MITGSISSTPTPSSSSSYDGAKIAGVVVGPIAAVVLIIGLAFIFFRRRRTNGTAAVYPHTQPVQPVMGWSQPYAGQIVVPKAELADTASPPNPGIPPAYQTHPQPSVFVHSEGHGEPGLRPV